MVGYLKFSLLLFLITPLVYSCAPSEAENVVIQASAESLTDTLVPYSFPWIKEMRAENMIINRVLLPQGFKRKGGAIKSYPDWLRRLPLKEGLPQVKLYNGDLKWNQKVHAAVLDIDCGREDLQQCADAVMRLRAEYLFAMGKESSIHFNFTSGDKASWEKWKEGWRPVINGNKVSWEKTAKVSGSYQNFKKYLRVVFMYAGSASLEKELVPVKTEDVMPGDIFIQGGHPGHAVVVMDVAENNSGKKVFLLAQSYMPAQDIHILKNPDNDSLSPWYQEDFGDILNTPEWTFKKTDLRRFRE